MRYCKNQICTQCCGICRIQQLKYRKWKIREYQRLRCELRFEENKLLLLLRVCMYALCSMVVLPRVSIDDTGARCAVRTWGVLCGVHVAHHPPQSPGYYTTTATSLKQTKHKRNSVTAAAVDKAYGAVIDIAAASCQSSRILWPHAFVSLESTRPCHMGCAFVRDI